MERYTTNKQNSLTKKQNVFQKYNFLKNEILKTKKKIRTLEKEIKRRPQYEANVIADIIYKQKNYLEILERKHSKMTKGFVKIGATLGIALTIASSSYGTYIENKNFDNNVVEAYQSVQSNDEGENLDVTHSANEILYKQLKLDIKQYVELSKKEKLTKEEKQSMEKIKTRINSNPEAITMLSLDILKQKIANSIGEEDYSKIRIEDKSTQVRADKYNSESGSKRDIAIYADGKEIASFKDFQSLATGEITKTSDNIPKNVLNAIDKIVKAQSDSQNTKKATKALKTSLELDEKDISFDNVKNVEKDEER